MRGYATPAQPRLFDSDPVVIDHVHCLDCGVDTHKMHELFIVHDDLWPLAPQGGVLCVACLEQRIGRRLEPRDFPRSVPLNRYGGSARLRSRILTLDEVSDKELLELFPGSTIEHLPPRKKAMTPQYDDELRGVLFREGEKKSDRAPDYRGSVQVEGKRYRLSGWLRESSKTGKRFLSLRLTLENATEF
jgi:hypothetical protein